MNFFFFTFLCCTQLYLRTLAQSFIFYDFAYLSYFMYSHPLHNITKVQLKLQDDLYDGQLQLQSMILK